MRLHPALLLFVAFSAPLRLCASYQPGSDFVRGPDMGGGVGGILYSLRSPGNLTGARFYHYDARGDVVAQTDSTPQFVYNTNYDAYGRHDANDALGGTSYTTQFDVGTNPDRYTTNTRETDPTGLLYENHRYRDLQTNVYLTRDPAGFIDTTNLYSYVKQNPFTHWDPLGLAVGLQPVEGGGSDDLQSFKQREQAVRDGSIPRAPLSSPAVNSFVADSVPLVGTAKSIQETVMGVDAFTQQPIPRMAAAVGIVAEFIPVGGAVIKRLVKGGGKAVVKDAEKVLVKQGEKQASNVVESSAKAQKEITIDAAKHPETAQHIADAQAAGHPDVVTIDRTGVNANRGAATGGLDKVPGKQLDEYPPAMFKEGGAGASVRPITPADNMGAGASMGNQLRNVPDGTKVQIKVKDSNTPSS